jgi:drug/metabolite transporter (DMT)-like permease
MCLKGVSLAIVSAALWAAVGVILAYTYERDPTVNPLEATFIRIVVNLLLVIVLHRIWRKRAGLPWGDRRPTLWVWGGLGALTICTYFWAVQRVGAAEATLFQGAQVFLIAVLGPKLIGDRFSWLSLCGSILGMFGFYLFFQIGSPDQWGKMIALGSGVCAGLAYLILANEKNTHSLETIGFYWSICSLLFLGVTSVFVQFSLSWNFPALYLLVGASVLASCAQILTSYSYSRIPAAVASATTYLIPAFAFCLEFLLWQKTIGKQAIAALAIILIAGLVVPLWRWRGESLATKKIAAEEG